jgi:hypothetical protein
MRVRITQIDGKLPNIALMKLARYHRDRGDEIYFTKNIARDMLEPSWDRVYGSAIFSFSADRVAEFKAEFSDAVVGGTYNLTDSMTVEQFLRIDATEALDYSIYSGFDGSIGFTQRGCRLKCGFCVVPKKEGKPRSVNTVDQIWRGEPYPRHLHLLDNDFFGQPREQWEARVEEIRRGKFKVCFNQGINIRMVDASAAKALGLITLRDDQFKTRRLYTAWDNVGDERHFFNGVDLLESHGVAATCLMVYMLIGYDKRETWERVFYRFEKMAARGIRPYPMIYGERDRGLPLGDCNRRVGHRTLSEFQRWAIRKAYTFVPFEDYDVNAKGRMEHSQIALPI